MRVRMRMFVGLDIDCASVLAGKRFVTPINSISVPRRPFAIMSPSQEVTKPLSDGCERTAGQLVLFARVPGHIDRILDGWLRVLERVAAASPALSEN